MTGSQSLLDIRSPRSRECNMAKFSKRIEMLVYRFILSLVVGFFVGSYLIANSDSSVIKTLGKFVCRGPNVRLPKTPQDDDDDWLPKREARLDKDRGTLYVGMMSMTKYLDTRVAAVIDTWTQNGDIRFEIFSNNNGSDGHGPGKVTVLDNGARIIQLPGVSDVSYPPQKKSFSMLKYVHDNHLENFDWFLRADDDAYVKLDELKNLLSRADPRKPHFIGHAGYGKHAEDYLEYGENYCMGGTGVIFSRELLRRIGPKLSDCLREMLTEHEDIELGRCVRKIAGVSCTESWETTGLFYQNYGGKGSYDMNIKDISERKRAAGVIFHANKDPKYQYKLHRTILKDKITKVISRITHMETEVKKMSGLLVMHKFDDKSWNAHAGYIWNSISQKSVYTATSNLVRSIPTSIKEAAVRNVFFTIQELRARNPQLPSRINEISVTHTRYFVSPLTSVDMVSRLRVQGQGGTGKKPVRIFLEGVYFRRTFPDKLVYFTEGSNIDFSAIRSEKSRRPKGRITTGEPRRVNFVMALSGRPENLIRFLQNYKDSFLANGENVSLTLVYFPENTPTTEKGEQVIDVDEKAPFSNTSHKDQETQFVVANLNHVRKEYPTAIVNFILVTNGLPFSRGGGLQMGAKTFRNEELLFFCDVDLVFQQDMVHHIQRSTIRGQQAYYPTFFSQYDPEIVYSYHETPKTHFYFEEIAGFWRTFSYGMVSIYKSDFLASGGFDLSIRGWGLEDLKFADAVVKKAGLQIFKSNEPEMVHIYHDKDCPSDLKKEQHESCQKSRAQHFGPQTLLYYVWLRGDEVDEQEEEDPNVKVDAQAMENPGDTVHDNSPLVK